MASNKKKNGNNKKPGGCFGCLGCLGLILIFGLLFGACSAIFSDETEEQDTVDTRNEEITPVEEKQEEPAVTEDEPVVEEEKEDSSVTEDEPVVEEKQESEPAVEEAPESVEPAEEEPVAEEETVVEEEEPVTESVYYKNCSEARAAGAAPVHKGEPGYASHLDRDGDGIGCDS
nr:excalibur calcium-binding domain-containing protein [Domibacillus indicus]